MSLPDRTLCWVEGPPWDRTCEPVGSLLPSEETALDETLLNRRLERLGGHELGVVLALVLARVEELGVGTSPEAPCEPASRWAGFSYEEMIELDEMVSATDESYDLTPLGEKISLELDAEIARRKSRRAPERS